MSTSSPLATEMTHLLASLPTLPQLLALGEPTHGLQSFPYWRNALLQVLVQEHGFRSVAMESDILAGQSVNAYVLGETHDLESVMATGFSHGFGAYAANRDLVTWLRHWNDTHAPGEQVHYYGFDAPMENMWAASPRPNLLALHSFLTTHLFELEVQRHTIETLCGNDTRWTNEAAAMNPAQSMGNTPEARELRLLTDDLCTLLQREKPRLHAQTGHWGAELHARTAVGLLRYHANMARTAPDRLPTMLSLRDLMMADNLQAIAQREQRRGGTLVFAHNLHLQRGVSGMNMAGQRLEWWGAGAHLTQRLGNAYAFIASGLGQASALNITEPEPETLEGHLLRQSGEAQLFSRAEVTQLLGLTLQRRTDFPPQAFPLKKTLLEGADGLLFIRDAT